MTRVRRVARQDLRSVSRSRGLWAAGTLLAVGATLLAYWMEGYQQTPTEAVLSVLRSLTQALGVGLPIVAVVASYLAIAGERQHGGIKFLLGVPNTRRDVFLGKFASRLVLVGGGLSFVFLAFSAVALARHGTLPLGPTLGLFAVGLVYAAVFVAIAVALSGAVRARGRAIAVSFASYFGLVVLFVVPGMRPSGIVGVVHQRLLGAEPDPVLYDTFAYLSPYVAFRKATNLVFPAGEEAIVFPRSVEAVAELPFYLADGFALVIFAGWLVAPVALGYWRFQGADLE